MKKNLFFDSLKRSEEKQKKQSKSKRKMHKYPSWVLKEIDSEIDDVIITDSNADLLLSGTPKTGGGRGKISFSAK